MMMNYDHRVESKDEFENPVSPVAIGIMADSHGRPDKIVAALKYLSDLKCDSVYHLGDICDSGHPETVEACVRTLQRFRVMAIKGNNDHQIDLNHRDRVQSIIPRDVYDFIKNLPLLRHFQQAVFAHSLPFVRELGLSSMVGVLGEVEVKRILSAFPKGIFFRGHSHTPEVFVTKGEKIIPRPLRAGQRFELNSGLPYVVTCGALTRNLCMIWKPQENAVESHRFS
jgi:predicted phosphodiesterase